MAQMNGITRPKLKPENQRLVEEWLELDKNPKTSAEIQALADGGDESELQARLGSRMPFGTAGLRAKMGAGYSRMNDLTVIQTSQGFACYVKEQFGAEECQKRGVVIGYDARHNSLRFAELAACVFLNSGFKVYLFSEYTPTPFTPYIVRTQSCLAGVQVTASHNPMEYNGYKVYWANGSQIIPPHDSRIQVHITRNLAPWPTSWDTTILKGNPKVGADRGGSSLNQVSFVLTAPFCDEGPPPDLVSAMERDQIWNEVTDPLPSVLDGYFTEIQQYCYRRVENSSLGVKVTYSPMHGVGGDAVRRSFKAFNLPEFIPVKEQIEPDPDFPTVRFPNPEEGKSALDLSMQTADKAGSTIILSTDPDADRLALAEKSPVTGKWKVFSGNETGTLLSWWAFKNYKENNPDFDGSKVHMLASTVSSKFIGSLAQIEGFQFEETLTGFKWMGNRAYDLLNKGHEVLFAFEEAIGFMFGTTVLDKDGVSVAAVMAEYAGWLYAQNKTFGSHLEDIYLRYGRFASEVSYYLCYSQETIGKLFNRLREGGKYAATCGSAKVVSVVDLTVGYNSRRPPDYKPILPVDPNTQMITFTLDNRCIFTLRTSGTEPKIKYYVELFTEPGSQITGEELNRTLKQTVENIVQEFLQPEHFGLIPRPT